MLVTLTVVAVCVALVAWTEAASDRAHQAAEDRARRRRLDEAIRTGRYIGPR